MRIKYYLLGIICFFSICVSFAQHNKIDSLFNKLKTAKQGEEKINCLNDLSWEFSNSNPDTSIIISMQALDLAERSGLKKFISQSYGLLGAYYYFKADYSQALDYYLKALKINEEIKNNGGIATMLGNIGIVYDDIGEKNKALEYYLKALKMDEALDNKSGIARHIGNIGRVYSSQKNHQMALEYFFKFLKMGEELKDKGYIAIATSNIGLVYLKQADYPKALEYFFNAIKIDEELGNKTEIARNLCNIASAYTQTKKYNESFTYLFEALKVARGAGSIDEIKNDYEELSLLFERSSIPLRDSIGGKLLNMEQMRLYALHYHKLFIALRDTLWSAENKSQLLQKEMNFEFSKKIAVAKAEQDKKDALAKAELDRKEQELNYFIVGFVLVIVLALFIFRGYKQKQKANLLLADKNKIIEEKNKDITDSIHYAKRIQTSLLPTEKYIERLLNDKDKKAL